MRKTFILFVLFTALVLTSCSNGKDSINDNPQASTISSSQNGTKSTQATSQVTPSTTQKPDSTASPDLINKLGGAKADDFYIGELITNYESLIIYAINNNEFSAVESLLVPGSNLYNSQKKLVVDLYNQKIQEKLIGFEIKDIKSTEKDGILKIYVNEKIGIKYADKQDFETKEYNWIYTAIKSDNKVELSDIEKWNR